MNTTRENAAGEHPADGRDPAGPPVMARPVEFPPLAEEGPTGAGGLGSMSGLMDVNVTVTAELGRIKRSINNILKLRPRSLVNLERGIAEPVDLLVQGTWLARAEVGGAEDRSGTTSRKS